jgi:DNA-binding response OmpR family regulator
MTDLTLMTAARNPATVLPSLTLLSHRVRVLPLNPSALPQMPEYTILFMDARENLAACKSICRLIHTNGLSIPIILVVTDGGFTVINSEWGVSELILPSASPAEVEARLRLVNERGVRMMASGRIHHDKTEEDNGDGIIRSGDLVINTAGYSATFKGKPLNLAYKEFELLKYLAEHPGRVFTRAQLLQGVWGYDYYGGTRTVDVHVRRLRAKLGKENQKLIGTVRNVGYRYDPPASAQRDQKERDQENNASDQSTNSNSSD